MKKLLTSTSFFLLLSSLSFAQPFIATYNACFFDTKDDGDGNGEYIDEVDDGFLIFNSNFGSCFSVLKINHKGDSILHKEYMLPETDRFRTRGRGFAKDENGDYFFTGGTFRSDSDIYLFKISGKNLDLLWAKRYRLPLGEYPNSIRLTEDKIVILGTKEKRILLPDNSIKVPYSHLFFLEADKNGNMLDTVSVKGEYTWTQGGDFHYLPSGDIAVAYSSTFFNIEPRSYRAVMDSDYNIKWTEHYGAIDGDIYYLPLLSVSPDTSVIYYTFTEGKDLGGIWRGASGVVIACKPDGEVLWKRYLPAYGFKIYSLHTTPQGDIIGSGNGGLLLEHPFYAARAFKLNADGEVLFDNRYRYFYEDGSETDDTNKLFDAVVTSSGSVIATGYVATQPPKPAYNWIDIYVLGLDKNGCLTPDCDSIVLPSARVSSTDNINHKVVGLFPNPATNHVSIDYPPTLGQTLFSLFSVAGKNVINKLPTSPGQQINIAHLSKGIYFYQLHTDDRHVVETGKLVVN